MNIALWILQIVLAAGFVAHSGLMLRPPKGLPPRMAWVLEMPAGLRVFAGVAEGLAGIGLVLPALLRTLVWLTPIAAAGLVLLMLGAMVFHFARREYLPILFPNAFLGALAAVVAWGRFGPYHF